MFVTETLYRFEALLEISGKFNTKLNAISYMIM